MADSRQGFSHTGIWASLSSGFSQGSDPVFSPQDLGKSLLPNPHIQPADPQGRPRLFGCHPSDLQDPQTELFFRRGLGFLKLSGDDGESIPYVKCHLHQTEWASLGSLSPSETPQTKNNL